MHITRSMDQVDELNRTARVAIEHEEAEPRLLKKKNLPSTRRHAAHPVSVLILHPTVERYVFLFRFFVLPFVRPVCYLCLFCPCSCSLLLNPIETSDL